MNKVAMYSSPVRWKSLAVILLIATSLMCFTPPVGLSLAAWQTLIIFISCIAAIIANVLPIGAIGIIGITVYALFFGIIGGLEGKGAATAIATKVALSELSSSLIWLIVCAFLVARGFIKTGFGKRIALLMVRLFGKRTLGLAYGLAFADLLLAPAMPSNTARCGGVIYPIANSLALNFDSKPNDPSSKKLGSFLITSIGTVNDITSALFLTAFTGNLAAVGIARGLGIEFDFANWLLYASVPCIVAIVLVPLCVYLINPPDIKHTPDAPKFATQQLNEMGKMSYGEIMMLLTVILLLILWVFGSQLQVDSTIAAMVGLVFLLLTGVLTWDDVKAEKGAWDTLIWFAALLMMANQLNKLGFTKWFGETIATDLQSIVQGMDWIWVLLILNMIYLYTHYFFASGNAQILALYAVFAGVMTSLGVPLPVAAFMLAMSSNLYCSLTQYSHARGPILFGSGYVSSATWWRTGFIISILTQLIFFTVGVAWWKMVGMY